MKRKLKKKRNLIILIILLIYISPFSVIKLNTVIDIRNETNKGGSKTHSEKKSYNAGVSISLKEIKLDDLVKVDVKFSSVLNLGFYSKIEKEVFFKKIVNGDTIKTTIKAKSNIWGLGNIIIRKEKFNKILKEEINRIYLKK